MSARQSVRTRVTLDAYLEGLDRQLAVRLLEGAREQRRRTSIPCEIREGDAHPECPPPGPHESCRWCFSWRDCDDPDCTHPACGHHIATLFREAWTDATDEGWVDVFIDRDDPAPIEAYARMPVLVNQVPPDEQMGRKILNALTRRREWQQLHHMRLGDDPSKYLAGEVWLAQQQVPVEVSCARYGLGVWTAYDAARGIDTRETKGGCLVAEFRLTEALTLEDAPDLTQGALF